MLSVGCLTLLLKLILLSERLLIMPGYKNYIDYTDHFIVHTSQHGGHGELVPNLLL